METRKSQIYWHHFGDDYENLLSYFRILINITCVCFRWPTKTRGSTADCSWYRNYLNNSAVNVIAHASLPGCDATSRTRNWWRHRAIAHAQYERRPWHALHRRCATWSPANGWYCTAGNSAQNHARSSITWLRDPCWHASVRCLTYCPQRSQSLHKPVSVQPGEVHRWR